ncbi:MAG: T9SS type A sorting domain-containing protein [Leadbetterella sp.]|nr:T9SS type A sorting domain-containing protein [Leadbetterella sp.]
MRDVWYPSALADALVGESVNGNSTDIVLKINRNTEWNLNYQGAQNFRYYDMLSVIIHEIAHGIGFMSSFEQNGDTQVKWGIQNLPFIYDRYIVDENSNSLVNNRFYSNDSEALLEAVTGNAVFFQIDSGAYSQRRPRLHTERTFAAGASLSHIAVGSGIPDNRDRLMLPTLSLGARYHYPGNGILAMLFQLGWALNFYEFEREYDYPPRAFSVFPNPGSDEIFLKISDFNPDEEMDSYLIDASGRVLNSHKLNTSETRISLKELPAGRYFLKVGEVSLPVIKL